MYRKCISNETSYNQPRDYHEARTSPSLRVSHACCSRLFQQKTVLARHALSRILPAGHSPDSISAQPSHFAIIRVEMTRARCHFTDDRLSVPERVTNAKFLELVAN